MGGRLALVVGLAGLLAPSCAAAASPSIVSMESSVRLGLTAGYGYYEEDIQPRMTGAGPVWGVSTEVSALLPDNLARYGWPDLYTSVAYDVSDGFLHGHAPHGASSGYELGSRQAGWSNTAIVRLGLGSPVADAGEVIPYLAAGYRNWYHVPGTAPKEQAFYQTGLVGLGVKLDVAASRHWVVSADAEGLAVLGGSDSGSAGNFSTTFGPSAEERVSLDADYRLDGAWHGYAGLGVTHYGYIGAKSAEAGSGELLNTTLQIDSMVGIAYGF